MKASQLSKETAIKTVAKRIENIFNDGLDRQDYDTGMDWKKALEKRAEWILNDIDFDELLRSFKENNS